MAQKPVRDPQYLKFLRLLPCVCCTKTRNVEAAHFGARGMSQKASDLDALPLCRWCHQTGPQSYHTLGARRFVEVQKLNVELHQAQCREGYQRIRRVA